jgi:hypothetical protein
MVLSMALTLSPEGVVLAAVMMRRGGNRARLLTLIGGAPHDAEHFHQLSTRQAAYVLGTSTRYVHRVLVELVAAGVLERRAGAGSRADAWRVRGDVRRWSVLWPVRRDADHVRLILSDAGHVIEVEAPQLPKVSLTPIGQRNGKFVATFMGSDPGGVVLTHRGQRGGSGLRQPMAVDINPSSSSEADDPGCPSTNGERKRRSESDVYAAELARIVRRMTGRPAIGRGLERLAALSGSLPLDRAEHALAGLPTDAGWPMVLGALEAEAAEPIEPGRNGKRVTVMTSWTVDGKAFSAPQSPEAALLGPPGDADPGSWEVSEPW